MGFITRQILLGIECDKRDCGAEIEASAGPFWTVRDDLIAEAVAEGWRCFVGRSQRWYCPDAGELNHFMCGWCSEHNDARHHCGCIMINDPALAAPAQEETQ